MLTRLQRITGVRSDVHGWPKMESLGAPLLVLCLLPVPLSALPWRHWARPSALPKVSTAAARRPFLSLAWVVQQQLSLGSSPMDACCSGPHHIGLRLQTRSCVLSILCTLMFHIFRKGQGVQACDAGLSASHGLFSRPGTALMTALCLQARGTAVLPARGQQIPWAEL